MNRPNQRILILGGGFGGLYAALRLEKIFSGDESVEITLVSDENFLLFTPMLPEVPSGSIEAKHIVSPLRAFLRKVKFQNANVESIDLQSRVVVASHCGVCGPRELKFDHLVLALGSTTQFHGLVGVAENAFPMKSLSDAMVLRNHIIDVFEHADMQSDPATREAMLTFVVAGGGFAGAETVAELRDFAYTVRRYYSNIRPEEVKVVLVHSGPRIMPEISETLAVYAANKLKTKGIDVVLNTRVVSAASDWVDLSNGQRIVTRTLIWTTGVTPSPLLATTSWQRNKRGQIAVNEFLEVPGHPGIWALGDCAEIPTPQAGQYYPPTAQHAIRQGTRAAENIAASIKGGRRRPFIYKPLGMLASLGRRSAVAEVCGLRFSGFLAWWLWRTVYLFKLPGFERKVRVALDWTLDLFFPRDIVLLKLVKNRAQSEGPAARVGTE